MRKKRVLKVKGIAHRKAKKPAAKVRHKSKMVGRKKKQEATGIYEEITIVCPGCGRTAKVIKIEGLDTEGMICQRCAKGEVEIEEMDF